MRSTDTPNTTGCTCVKICMYGATAVDVPLDQSRVAIDIYIYIDTFMCVYIYIYVYVHR